jgi:LmbE family N-acetylglucosaminyl deacetylase
MNRILIVAAHPDDEILGCGGTIARLVEEGNEAFTLILGEGITSRDKSRDAKKRKNEIEQLKKQTLKANKEIGVKQVFTNNFPDNRFDTVPFLDVVKAIEQVKDKVKPDVIYTHYCNDLNIDHKITYNAVITATRPVKGETVKIIYSFEVLSSTEWNYPLSFSPNVFFDVTDTIRLKLKAMECYKEELRDEEHPRSLNAIEINSRLWGMKSAMRYSEAFVLVRDNI